MTRTSFPLPEDCTHDWYLMRSLKGGHFNWVVCRHCLAGMDFAEYNEKQEKNEMGG